MCIIRDREIQATGKYVMDGCIEHQHMGSYKGSLYTDTVHPHTHASPINNNLYPLLYMCLLYQINPNA